MDNKQVVIFPRGQLSAKDRQALTKNGIVAIEAEDPTKVVAVIPMSTPICADDLMMSLLEAVAKAGYDSVSRSFVVSLNDRTKAREAGAKAPAKEA